MKEEERRKMKEEERGKKKACKELGKAQAIIYTALGFLENKLKLLKRVFSFTAEMEVPVLSFSYQPRKSAVYAFYW